MNKNVIQFVKDNLGKEIITKFGKGLIVGHDDEHIIIGLYSSGSWIYLKDTDNVIISL